MNARTAPIHGIVPPHILREIAQRGDPGQRARALQTLAVSERLRGRREALGALGVAAPPGEKRRAVFDARHGYDLPGVLVRAEDSGRSRDPAVTEAFDGAGATYDFYREAFDRNSIDDRGMRLESTVHFGEGYDNAFWNGAQMVYGDGDGELFGRFTASLEVIGHELSHGVIQHEANLDYAGQAGALNESFADVLGSLVKQKVLRQTAAQADWLIGRGLFAPGVHGSAIRSMKAPGTAYDDPVLGRDPQCAHMKDYVHADYDNGGVHINSGIPNHAFYRAAMEIGGSAWARAGRIWYLALRDRLRHGAGFRRAAGATLLVAGEIFGAGSLEQRAVRDAWKAVGVEAEAGDRTTSRRRAALPREGRSRVPSHAI